MFHEENGLVYEYTDLGNGRFTDVQYGYATRFKAANDALQTQVNVPISLVFDVEVFDSVSGAYQKSSESVSNAQIMVADGSGIPVTAQNGEVDYQFESPTAGQFTVNCVAPGVKTGTIIVNVV